MSNVEVEIPLSEAKHLVKLNVHTMLPLLLLLLVHKKGFHL